MKLIEQRSPMDSIAGEENLTAEEKFHIALKYKIVDTERDQITKKGGEILFKNLPIEKWYELVSSKEKDDIYHQN
jgi:hypothetical protein